MPIDTLSDEQRLLQRQGRRRLIGACVLVALAILLLPPLLEKKSVVPPQPSDIEVEVISAEGEASSEVVRSPKLFSEAAVSAPGDVGVKPILKKEPNPPIAVRATAPVELRASAPLPHPPWLSSDGSKRKPPKKRVNVKAAPTGKSSSTPLVESTLSQAAFIEGGAEVGLSVKPWVVQFAALSDPLKATALLQTLSSKGVKAFVITEHGRKGELSKVRAGPYRTFEAAEAARKKVAVLGFSAVVVSKNAGLK